MFVYLQLYRVLERERDIARVHVERGNRQMALLCLKKRKFQESLIGRTEQQLWNLEQLTHTIEFALVEKQMIEGLRVGNEVLHAIHEEMSLDNVEKLMEDTREAVDYQQVSGTTIRN
jgi:charged multivesicular body protein 6